MKPCPFCGRVPTGFYSGTFQGTRNQPFCAVVCPHPCAAEGPMRRNEQEATEAWNSRVSSIPPGDMK
jgi:Lar family restriction alleviation protein